MKLKSQEVYEGAGVKLNRVFSNQTVKETDPFLLLDHFKSNDYNDYIKGFPWHPHRGIETVTYMIEGEVEHQDSLGNKGIITSGDVQWMTAGSGIIHQEMPKKYEGLFQGFQLWVNLPKKDKMTNPKYREIKSSKIPVVEGVKVIAGEYKGVKGPISDLKIDISYFDVSCKDKFNIKTKKGFVYVFENEGMFNNQKLKEKEFLSIENELSVEGNCRFLLIQGVPLNEPIVWGGPIVMNTMEELELAFKEFREGNFIKN